LVGSKSLVDGLTISQESGIELRETNYSSHVCWCRTGRYSLDTRVWMTDSWTNASY